MVESTAKLREEILALSGVDIMLDDNTFKSTYQILDELAVKWEDLTDIQQASITELIAGKRQGNVVSSLMTNFDTARDALETSLNSSGSAMREHEKWQQSLEAQINKLKASWQGLSQAFMKSDFLHGALNAVIGLVDGLTKLIDTVGTLPTLLGTAAAGLSLFKNKGLFTFDKDAKSIQLLGNGFTDLKGKYTQIQTAISRYNSMSSKSAAFQEKYNKAMAGSSTSMGTYLRGLNGAKASFGGYIGSLVGATVKTIALEAATTLLNTALTMGISLAIQGLITLFDKLIVTSDELAEKVEEVVSKFEEEHSALKELKRDYDTTNESSMISRYEKLSKGVDNLGRNVSLTADEYSEYQDIVNSIADQIPSLITGYDEQGNALLSCKGNVEELTEAYEKLIHAQNQQILTNAGDIEKDFANTVKNTSGEDWWSNGHGFWVGLLEWTSGFGGLLGQVDSNYSSLFSRWFDYELKDDTIQSIEGLLNAKNESEKEAILRDLESDRYAAEEIRDALTSSGIEVGTWESPLDVLAETIEDDPQKLKNIVDNYYASFAEVIEQQKTIATAKLSEAFDVSSAISGLNYGNISEELQAIAYQTVSNFDYDFLSELSESGKTVEQWTTEMLNQLNAISEADSASIELGFDLQTQFNGGEISYGEYVANLQNIEDVIDSLNLKGEVKEQLRISLGLDDGGVIDQYNALVERLTDSENYDFNISESEARKLLNGLSSEELAVAVDVITEMSDNNVNETIDQIRDAIEKELTIRGLSLDLSIETETAKLEAFAAALSESASGLGLSKESLAAIEGMFGDLNSYDPAKLFERTANGIRLNSDELRRLNSEYKKTNISDLNKEMDTLGDIYNQTKEELYGLTYGTEEYNAKAAELDGIEERIRATEQLAAQYEGLASAYQEWQMTEAAGSQRDMYEGIIEGFENVDDEISRGWYDDGTIEFLELLTGKDLSTAGIEEIKEAYRSLGREIENTSYNVRDFFTVDDEGNSTNAGIYNFLDAVGQLEEEAFGGKDVVQRKDGKIVGFDFQIAGGDEAIAEALGISEELVQIMVRAADDAGFVVSMDGTYQQLDILKEKAAEAAHALKETYHATEYSFFQDGSEEGIAKDYQEALRVWETFAKNKNADGTVNMSVEGAEEAYILVSTLQSMVDQLSEPVYMELDASEVEKEMQTPLSKLQEYETLLQTEHQLKLKGTDTSAIEADKEEILDYFEGLSPEIKADLGIDGDSRAEIEQKLEDGTIQIPATVDLQVEMNETLRDMVNVALYSAGLIDGEELETRVDISVYAEDVDTSDVADKTEEAVREAVEDKSDEEVAVETTVELEATIDEALDLIDKLEDKDITIDVEVKGLDDVKELAQNIEIATHIEGSVEKLSEYVEGAKALSGLDDNIESKVTAYIYGNVIDEFEYKLNNLSLFADGAKDLKGVGDVSTTVTAYIYGNVTDEFEYKLNNLSLFADGAKALKDVGNIDVSVTADVDGNVIDRFEYKLNNLSLFADGAKALKDVGDVSTIVAAYIDGNVIDEFEYKINNLIGFADGAKVLKGVGDVSTTVTANIKGNVIDEFEYKLNNIIGFADGVKKLQGLDDVDLNVNVSMSTATAKILERDENTFTQDLQTLAEGLSDLQGVEDVDLNIDISMSEGTTKILERNEGSFIQDLQTLAQGVSDLQGFEDVKTTIDISMSEGTSMILERNEGSFIQDLQTLAQGVSDLQGVEDVDLDINVSMSEGTSMILERNEGSFIQDLQTLAQGVSDLQGLEDVKTTIDISMSEGTSMILERNEGSFIQDLQTLAQGVTDLQGLEDVKTTIDISMSEGTSMILERDEDAFIQDLQTLAQGVSTLQGLEDVNLGINISMGESTAMILERDEDAFIQDLQTLAQGISQLQGLESVNLGVNVSMSTATAMILDRDEDAFIQDLQTLAKGVTDLQGLKDVDLDIDVSMSTATSMILERDEDAFIQDLQTLAKGVTDLQGLDDVDLDIDVSMSESTAMILDRDEDAFIQDLQTLAKGVSALQGLESVDIDVDANVSGNVIEGEDAANRLTSLQDFSSIVNNLSSNSSVSVNVSANVDFENVNAAYQLLTDIANSGVFKNYTATVQVGATIATIDDTTVQNYQAPAKEGKVKYSVDPESTVFTWTAPDKEGVVNYSATVEALTDAQKYKTGTITYQARIEGVPQVNGTANVNGSAFASGTAYKHGDWGTKKTTTALTGELGQELVVYKNRYWTVGDNGAEFATIPKGAIVFNHKQTEELFKNGRVTSDGGRGKALVGGTAFAEGTAFSEGEGGAGSTSGNPAGTTTTPSSTDSSDTDKEFEEVFDWIETILDRVERSIDKFDQQANNIYSSWSKRNNALLEEISEVNKEITLQQSAYDYYMQQANSVGLDESWASKVRDGSIDISVITDEDLADKIKDYEEW